jgi:hypothetical protein
VTSRLGAALLTARRAGARGPEATRFAAARVAFDGVVPESWTPEPRLCDGRDAW